MKKALFVVVLLLVTACGNYGPFPSASWPAHVAGFAGLTSDQQTLITDAIQQLNTKSNHVFLTTDNMNSSTYPIYFQLIDANQTDSSRAGLATMSNQKCQIQLSRLIFDPSHSNYLVAVVWHEVGHCGGLLHVGQANQIMSSITHPFDTYSSDVQSFFFKSLVDATGSN